MATNAVCNSCLRTLRLQARKELLHVRSISTPTRYAPHPNRSIALNARALSKSTSRKVNDPPKQTQQPPPPPQIPKNQGDAITSFAASVRNTPTLKNTTEPYIAYGSTEDLFRECARQCNYTVPSRLETPPADPPRTLAGEDLGQGEGWWYRPKEAGGLGLDVTFNTWAQVMYLHMYMLTVRLRCFPAKHARIWHQNLLDHFFYAAEDRMVQWHEIQSRSSRNKYLKDLWQQWRGVILSYDEGLIKGDAQLAAAIWRNVFKANLEMDVGDLALVTAYMRGQLQMLDGISDEKLASGDVQFGDPSAAKRIADQESPRMKQTISAEELKAVEQKTESSAS